MPRNAVGSDGHTGGADGGIHHLRMRKLIYRRVAWPRQWAQTQASSLFICDFQDEGKPKWEYNDKLGVVVRELGVKKNDVLGPSAKLNRTNRLGGWCVVADEGSG